MEQLVPLPGRARVKVEDQEPDTAGPGADEKAAHEYVDRYARSELDELLDAATAHGDEQAMESLRQAKMIADQPVLAELRGLLAPALNALRPDHRWSSYETEGLVAWRLRIPLREAAGTDEPEPALTYWVEDGDDEIVLYADPRDAALPTAFARHTSRRFAQTRDGARGVVRYLGLTITPQRPR